MLLLPVGLFASALASPCILDAYGAPYVAMSANKRLLTSWTGALIRVRRSIDNTDQDIGCTGANALDTAALLAWCGSGSGYITKVYDQSGAGRNAVQAVAANQPRIVNDGAVELLKTGGATPGMRCVSSQNVAAAATISGNLTIVASISRIAAAAAGNDVSMALTTKGPSDGGGTGLHFVTGNGYGPAGDAAKARIDPGSASCAGWLNGVKQGSTNPFDSGTGAGVAGVFGMTISGLGARNPLTLGTDTGQYYSLNGAIGSVVVFGSILADADVSSLTSALYSSIS